MICDCGSLKTERNGKCACCQSLAKYESALASAKESAVLVSDQEKAHGIIWRNYASKKDRQHGNELKPGIYPIPGLEWELVAKPVQVGFGRWGYEQVAILKESTPSHFNGCSPTACGCKSLADCPNNQPQITVMGQGYKFKKFPDRLKESTPSTEQESQEAIFEVIRYCRRTNLECSAGGYKTMFEYLKKNFTITRKP